MTLIDFIAYVLAGLGAGIAFSIWTGRRFDYLGEKRRVMAVAVAALGVILGILVHIAFTST